MSIVWPAGTRHTDRATLYDLTLASGDQLRVQAQEIIKDGASQSRTVIIKVGKGADVELTDVTQVTALRDALTAAAAVFS